MEVLRTMFDVSQSFYQFPGRTVLSCSHFHPGLAFEGGEHAADGSRVERRAVAMLPKRETISHSLEFLRSQRYNVDSVVIILHISELNARSGTGQTGAASHEAHDRMQREAKTQLVLIPTFQLY